MKKEYTNGEVTVTWEPNTCIHSKRCWQGLLQVFNPQNKPWINMDGASTSRIVEQVKKCPSGALGFYMNDAKEEAGGGTADMSDRDLVEVRLMSNGPMIVKGSIVIRKPDGSQEHCEGNTALCRCGTSSNKPFCDGTHSKAGFRDG